MKIILLKIIKIYKIIISPLLGDRCRFWPNCSDYCYQSIQKYGTIKGSFRGFRRILRCNPFNLGGVDKP